MNTRKPTKLPTKPVNSVNKFEKVGYKLANKVHKYAVLSLVFFVMGNVIFFAKEYNNYWRARRKPSLIHDMEKITKEV